MIVVVLAAAVPARALQTDVATAAEFSQIGAGARSLGMGEAYTAVADGPDAVYWNPGGALAHEPAGGDLRPHRASRGLITISSLSVSRSNSRRARSPSA